jgi:aminoglycoside phosphotransferase (APT) family kinase protein
MECVEGRVFWDLELPALAIPDRRDVYAAMVESLARLHTISPTDVGLADFGRPGNYFARQIARWSKQYRMSETRSVPEMDALIEWLPANIPDDDQTSIVHGDFRLDNMIFDSQKPAVLAVLDWELSTLGNPLADFTYHIMAWSLPAIGSSMSTLAGLDLETLGIPGEDEYVAMYCELTGRSGLGHRDFYAAYNLFRLGAIFQGIAGRVRDGTASSAHAAHAAENVRPLAQLGWDRARRAGAG